MKLLRRRPSVPEVAAPAAPAPQAPPAPPDARPPGAPASVFAGILDGQRLWVAVEARPGRLGLREAATKRTQHRVGDVVPLVDEAGSDDQPAYLGARLHLGGLPGMGHAIYDVVVVPPGGEQPVRVWTPPLAVRKHPPVTAEDGVSVFHLQRNGAGTLQVRRSRVRPGAVLLSCRADLDGIELIVGGAEAPATQVALVTADDSVVVSYPTSVEVRDGREVLRVFMTTAPADDVAPQVGRVMIGAPGHWQRIRRLDNDLGEPRRAVPLPRLEDPETGEPRLRLRWSNSAMLQGRLLDADESDDDTDDEQADEQPDGQPDAADEQPDDQQAGDEQ